MKLLIDISYDLSLGGMTMALVSFSLSLLLKVSYNVKQKTWKKEAYQMMWRFHNIGFAISAIGGVMLILYIWMGIRGAK